MKLKNYLKLLFKKKEFIDYKELSPVIAAMDTQATRKAIQFARINRKPGI